jgi:hypothetical protein
LVAQVSFLVVAGNGLGVTSLPIVPTIFMDSTLSEIWRELALHYFPADCFGINFSLLKNFFWRLF